MGGGAYLERFLEREKKDRRAKSLEGILMDTMTAESRELPQWTLLSPQKEGRTGWRSLILAAAGPTELNRCGKRLSGQGFDYVPRRKVRGSNFMYVISSYG